MGRGKNWTADEIEYLEESWGIVSRSGIARKLGRTVTAVTVKSQRLGLGDPLTHMDGITLSQLSIVLNTHYAIIKNWVKKYDFPVKRKRLVNKAIKIVTYEDFWIWADGNRQMLDFSRLDRLSLGPEPFWVEEKRKADQLRKLHKPKPHNTPWSRDEDATLQWMLEQNKYTYSDISKEIQRSQGAIKRRIRDLDLQMNPVRLYNHHKYTADEEKKLVELINLGYCFEEIADRLGEHRSALGVRGKLERLGYKFKNGVPYKADEREIS